MKGGRRVPVREFGAKGEPLGSKKELPTGLSCLFFGFGVTAGEGFGGSKPRGVSWRAGSKQSLMLGAAGPKKTFWLRCPEERGARKKLRKTAQFRSKDLCRGRKSVRPPWERNQTPRNRSQIRGMGARDSPKSRSSQSRE